MNEEWKFIPNYENYKVSNFGNVKNINYRNTGKELLLKGSSYNGYIHITLTKNNKSKTFLLHRLVAESFIPNIENKPCINHKDCNPQNNRIDNLEWCTQKENIAYMDKLKRRKSGRKITEEDVQEIIKKKNKGLSYKDVWIEYKDILTLSGFEKVWYKITWKEIGEDKE